MRKFLLSISMLITISMSGQILDCSELFISEYVEGSGNNKAIEIYNPTANTIDLSSYIVIRYSNGLTGTTAQNAVQLVGMISPYDVHVGVIEKLDSGGAGQEVPVADSLQAKADAFYCPDYNISFAWYFNGNDALVLAKGSVNEIDVAEIVDVFGKIGENPTSGAWTADAASGFQQGAWWTMDHTLIRKSSVIQGVTQNPALFDPSSEWDSIPEDSWGNLGSHNCDCTSISFVDEMNKSSYILYPNPAKKGQVVSVKSNVITKNIIATNILGGQVSFQNSINTSSLAEGIYILDIEFANGRHSSSKLIID